MKSLGRAKLTKGKGEGITRIAAEDRAAAFWTEVLKTPATMPVGEVPTLEAWQTHYLDKRYMAKDSTRQLDADTFKHLRAAFGSSCSLADINPDRAQEFERWMLTPETKTVTVMGRKLDGQGLSKATAAGHCRRAKAIFKAAIKSKPRRYPDGENPFDGTTTTASGRREKRYKVSREEIERLIETAFKRDKAPLAALIGLCAYAGMRRGEALALTWEDVKRDRLIVFSEKTSDTGDRLFREPRLEPELREVLRRVRIQQPRGAEGPCSGLKADNLWRDMRGYQQKNGKRFIGLMAHAGVPGWSQPYHNLRAWRAMTWRSRYPADVVDLWIGHSRDVAMDNSGYVSEEHYDGGADPVAELTAAEAQAGT